VSSSLNSPNHQPMACRREAGKRKVGETCFFRPKNGELQGQKRKGPEASGIHPPPPPPSPFHRKRTATEVRPSLKEKSDVGRRSTYNSGGRRTDQDGPAFALVRQSSKQRGGSHQGRKGWGKKGVSRLDRLDLSTGGPGGSGAPVTLIGAHSFSAKGVSTKKEPRMEGRNNENRRTHGERHQTTIKKQQHSHGSPRLTSEGNEKSYEGYVEKKTIN